jgi:hypothetical protein
LTLTAASAPPTALTAQLMIVAIAAVLVGPAFAYLYWLQQHGALRAGNASSKQLRAAVAAGNQSPGADGNAGSDRPHRLVATVVLAAAAAEIARDAVTAVRHRRRARR